MEGKTILIVDDSGVMLKTLSTKLGSKGYTTVLAEEGAQAVGIVRKQKVDLILLDIGFPPDVAHGGGTFSDGFGILSWLRRMDEGKGIPIIVITGSESPLYEKRSLDSGAAAFFRKPIDTDQLLAAISKALGEPAA